MRICLLAMLLSLSLMKDESSSVCVHLLSLSRKEDVVVDNEKCEDEFQSKRAELLPSAAKHELHYLNASGLWHAMSTTAKQKSKADRNRTTLDHARCLGLAWSLKRVWDQIQLARYDYLAQAVESGVGVAKSLAKAFEASTMGVYSDEFSSGLSTMQADVRRFFASETAKQQAKAHVHGSSAAAKE